MKKCVDIVVTYNRIKLLKENIQSLLNQTYCNHDIMVIDNGSTDETGEFIKSLNNNRILYYNTGKNLGGAGGFSYGLKKAIEKKSEYDYAWIMDDDSIPDKNALKSLIKKAEMIDDRFSFLASLVYWTDNKLFEMNIPGFEPKSKNDIDFELLSKTKLFQIDSCSFVGCFVNLNIAKNVGLPISEFFIYGDDVEYTSRLKSRENAYLDLDSKIIHKAPSNKGADIVTADKERIYRFFYQSRNGMYIAIRKHKIFSRFKVVIKRFVGIVKNSPNYKCKRVWVLLKGTFCGFFFNPNIQYVKLENIEEDK